MYIEPLRLLVNIDTAIGLPGYESKYDIDYFMSLNDDLDKD